MKPATLKNAMAAAMILCTFVAAHSSAETFVVTSSDDPEVVDPANCSGEDGDYPKTFVRMIVHNPSFKKFCRDRMTVHLGCKK